MLLKERIMGNCTNKSETKIPHGYHSSTFYRNLKYIESEDAICDAIDDLLENHKKIMDRNAREHIEESKLNQSKQFNIINHDYGVHQQINMMGYNPFVLFNATLQCTSCYMNHTFEYIMEPKSTPCSVFRSISNLKYNSRNIIFTHLFDNPKCKMD